MEKNDETNNTNEHNMAISKRDWEAKLGFMEKKLQLSVF